MAFSASTHPNLDIHLESQRLKDMPLEEVLSWIWENFGAKAAIGTSFQGSGLVIMHHVFAKLKLPFPVFTLDTGLLFPETLDLKRRLEDLFQVQIKSVTPDQTVEEQNNSVGPELWKTHPDTCCTLRKVMPLQQHLLHLDVWITGIRSQQNDFRKERSILERYEFDPLLGLQILKCNPMLNWSRDDVWKYLHEHNIPYNPLHDAGYRSIGCQPCTKISGSDDERAGRWDGFQKTECGIHTFLGQNI